MDFQKVTLEIQNRVGILTLNCPGERNAMTEAMAEDFHAAVQSVANDGRIKALVLTGAGSAFCAGADLEMLSTWAGKAPENVQKQLLRLYNHFLSLADLPIPTIAAVNGPAIGAGACLAMACDLRLAAKEARIGFTFVNLGLNPGMGAEYWLHRAVGPSRALELLMTGTILTAEEALAIGLVNHVVAGKTLHDQVLDLAAGIAAKPAAPIRAIKEIACTVPFSNLAETLRKEVQRQSTCFQSPNVLEGIRSIREKRPARFVEEP